MDHQTIDVTPPQCQNNCRWGCRVEVNHSRSGFKANIKGSDYDFLVFIYASSNIENDTLYPTNEREIYVFPRTIVEKCPKGSTGVNFNPKHINNYQEYKNAFSLISEA